MLINIYMNNQYNKMSYKAQYNNVVDEVREFGLKHRTNWVKQSGGVFGKGFVATEDKEKLKQYATGKNGTCVRESLLMLVKMNQKGQNPVWVQGELRGRGGDWNEIDDNKGMPMYHCWVELNEKVYDFSNGMRTIADRDLFYMYRRVVKSQEVPYQIIKKGEYEYSINHNCERDRQPFADKIRAKQRRFGYTAKE